MDQPPADAHDAEPTVELALTDHGTPTLREWCAANERTQSTVPLPGVHGFCLGLAAGLLALLVTLL